MPQPNTHDYEAKFAMAIADSLKYADANNDFETAIALSLSESVSAEEKKADHEDADDILRVEEDNVAIAAADSIQSEIDRRQEADDLANAIAASLNESVPVEEKKAGIDDKNADLTNLHEKLRALRKCMQKRNNAMEWYRSLSFTMAGKRIFNKPVIVIPCNVGVFTLIEQLERALIVICEVLTLISKYYCRRTDLDDLNGMKNVFADLNKEYTELLRRSTELTGADQKLVNNAVYYFTHGEGKWLAELDGSTASLGPLQGLDSYLRGCGTGGCLYHKR